MTETVIPQLITHAANAMPGHIGLYPGHPDNPYSAMGLWYYVPVFPVGQTPVGPAVNRNLPYNGLSNVQDYLNDLATFGPLLHENGSPVFFENQPMQQALPASGQISMNQINALFGRGNNLAAYRGTQWYTDSNASGTFPTGAIGLHDFYNKRPNSPVTPGAWDQQSPGYSDFYTPMHNFIAIQRMGGGGGGGAINLGNGGAQTWAFVGGSPANGGGGGGRIFLPFNGGFDDTYNYGGAGGTWGAGGNTNNIAGEAGQLTPHDIFGMSGPTGRGGNSAWGAGGAGVAYTVTNGQWNGNAGTLGSGGSGGVYTQSNAWYGHGGGGAGYTYDVFSAGVIGGVVQVYTAPGGGGADGIGGNGGNGRIYVNWG